MLNRVRADNLPVPKLRKQRGSMLVLAIFALVLFGLVGAASVRILNTTQLSSAYEVHSSRAYSAAESGVQREMQRIFPRDTAALACSAAPGGVSWSMNFNASVLGLKNCSAAVTCADFLADGERFYTITSTGTCGTASRTVTMQARSI